MMDLQILKQHLSEEKEKRKRTLVIKFHKKC